MLNDLTLFGALCNLLLYLDHDVHKATKLRFPQVWSVD